MKKLLALAVLLLAASPAHATDLGGLKDPVSEQALPSTPFNWSGIYIGLGAGGNLVSVTGDGYDGFGVSRESGFLEVSATGRFQFPHSPIVLGVRGDASWAPVYNKVGYGAGGEIGYALGNVLPFAFLEYRDQGGTNGYGFGGGIDIAVTKHVILGVKYERTEFNVPDGLSAVEDRGLAEIKIKLN